MTNSSWFLTHPTTKKKNRETKQKEKRARASNKIKHCLNTKSTEHLKNRLSFLSTSKKDCVYVCPLREKDAIVTSNTYKSFIFRSTHLVTQDVREKKHTRLQEVNNFYAIKLNRKNRILFCRDDFYRIFFDESLNKYLRSNNK